MSRKAIDPPAGHGDEAMSGRVTTHPSFAILEIGGVLFDLSTDVAEVRGEYAEEVPWDELAEFAYDLAMLLEARIRHEEEPLDPPTEDAPTITTEHKATYSSAPPPHFHVWPSHSGKSFLWTELLKRYGQ